MTVAGHNRALRAGEARAEELLPKLERVLEPILRRAGGEAARRFTANVTDHLTASADIKTAAGDIKTTPGDITLAAAVGPLKTMIALRPRPDEAAALEHAPGEPAADLHVTLAFLGDVEGSLEPIAEALRPVAAAHAPLAGHVGGIGSFDDMGDGHPGILLPDAPGLVELRQAACTALANAGVNYSRDHGYTAHMTVAYNDDLTFPSRDSYGKPLHFDELLIVRANAETVALPLVGAPPLTASSPPWTAPAANELIDVQALVAALRTKTDPVRLAVIETMMQQVLNGVGISFDVTNPFTARVLEQSGSQIVNIAETTQLNVMRIIREAYEQGLSIPDTAKAIRVGMTEASAVRARLIARCLPGETLVDAAVVRAVTRRWYEGDMAVLVTEAGREFTATPNHPMLTSAGWRAAGEVNEGDDLVCYVGDKDAGASRDEDVTDPPATIAEIFEAAAAVGVVERRRGGEPDFHGDGREGEVDIARPGRQLTIGRLAPLYEHLREEVFSPSDVIGGPRFCAYCGHLLAVEKGRCLCGASSGDTRLGQHPTDEAVGGPDSLRDSRGSEAALIERDDLLAVDVVAASGGTTAVLEVQRAGVCERAALPASSRDPLQDGALVNADGAGDLARALSGEIELDRVVSCRLVSFSGHVFNLVTPHGYFTVNGGYTGNTELAGAVNGGSLAATQIVSAATGDSYVKTWMTAPGAHFPRHDEYEGLNGQTVALDAYFDVGGAQLLHPGDPSGPPEEVCNCRCAMRYNGPEGGGEESADEG